MRHAKQLSIPLSAYYDLRGKMPDAGYGGAIPLKGYTDIRGLAAKYDRKSETLYLAFTAERSDSPLSPAPIPSEVAEAETIPAQATARGQIHTAHARTKAVGARALIAVPDVTEGVEPGSAEEALGTLPDKNESLLVVILPDEAVIPGFVYEEPLLMFFRDGKPFFAYVEEQSNTTLPAIIGTIDANLAPVTPSDSGE